MDLNHEEHEEILFGFLPSTSLRALRVLRGAGNCLLHAGTVLTVVILAACGGGDGGGSPPTATLSGTLAYVVSECRENADGFFLRQSLRVRQGEQDPITVMEAPDIGPTHVGVRGLCRYLSSFRNGAGFMGFGPLQHVAVSLDGAAVAFDVTDEFSSLGHNFLTPEQRGLFFVRADGTGLQRLGPASRHASFVPGSDYENPYDLVFSPDGRSLAFLDLGPGPGGAEAPQIIALDLATGTRKQLTRLPPIEPGFHADFPVSEGSCCPFFVDNDSVALLTNTNPEGLNPQGKLIVPIVNADGSGGLRLPPAAVAVPGSQIDTRFAITGQPGSLLLTVPGQPVNGPPPIFEIFFFDGHQNLLQLTNFHRSDTRHFPGAAPRQVFVVASADPFGTNPSENLQIFSVGSLGGDLRQLTQFHEMDRSQSGCGARPRGSRCFVNAISRDLNSGTLLFHSTCDPFGTNPDGDQFFTLGADGTGLRQLSQLRGCAVEADGTFVGEFPYPYAYPGSF